MRADPPSLGAIFEPQTSSSVARSLALAAALLAHGLLFAFTGTLGRVATPGPPRRPSLVVTRAIDLAPPTPRAPEPPPATASERPSRADRVPTAAGTREAAPAAPAAADVVSVAPDAEALDFSSDIVEGDSAAYAGGTTRSEGTSAAPVLARSVGPGGSGTNATGSGRARSARLPARNWRCVVNGAGDLGERPAVVLRVEIDASGRATNVAVVEAPNSEIGQAAAACARRTRFDAARDENGDPIAAALPPLRVLLAVR